MDQNLVVISVFSILTVLTKSPTKLTLMWQQNRTEPPLCFAVEYRLCPGLHCNNTLSNLLLWIFRLVALQSDMLSLFPFLNHFHTPRAGRTVAIMASSQPPFHRDHF